jgi:hypothetical protein
MAEPQRPLGLPGANRDTGDCRSKPSSPYDARPKDGKCTDNRAERPWVLCKLLCFIGSVDARGGIII